MSIIGYKKKSIIVRGGESTGLFTLFYEVIYRTYTAERFVIRYGQKCKEDQPSYD